MLFIRQFIADIIKGQPETEIPQQQLKESKLLHAIETRSLPNLQKLTENSQCDLNAPIQPHQTTALHFLVAKSHMDECDLELFRTLLASGRCNVNVTDSNGRTPLHYAAIKQHTAAAQLLIADQQCDLNLKDKIGGLSALHHAAIHVQPNTSKPFVLDLLLSHSGDRCDVNITTGSWNENILHVICRHTAHRLYNITKLLSVTHFSGWDAEDRDGVAALYRMVREFGGTHEREILLLMESNKCDLSKVDKEGDSILHHAVRKSRKNWIKILFASEQGGKLINVKNKKGECPIHLIPLDDESWEKSVLIILKHPMCDVNVLDTNGSPILHVAVGRYALEVIDMLINCGRCDLKLRDSLGRTALHIVPPSSVYHDFSPLQRLLLDMSIYDVNDRDARGMTPLMCLVRCCNSSVQHQGAGFVHLFTQLKFLIDHGADVNIEDGIGQSAVYFFVTNFADGERECKALQMLFDIGIDTQSKGQQMAMEKLTGLQNLKSQSFKKVLSGEGVLPTNTTTGLKGTNS